MLAFVKCFSLKRTKYPRGYEDPHVLASETPFTVNEIEALHNLFKKLSTSIFNDGLIHKEEFLLALFRNSSMQNLFADRVFHMFDRKRNGVIEFGEFVRSLSIFHPHTPEHEKSSCTYLNFDLFLKKLWDLPVCHAGVLSELKELLQDEAMVAPPRVFVRGRYLGGAEEVTAMNENGKFGRVLRWARVERVGEEGRFMCEGCGGARWLPCLECGGSCKVAAATKGEGWERCLKCNENGLVRCPVCFVN